MAAMEPFAFVNCLCGDGCGVWLRDIGVGM